MVPDSEQLPPSAPVEDAIPVAPEAANTINQPPPMDVYSPPQSATVVPNHHEMADLHINDQVPPANPVAPTYEAPPQHVMPPPAAPQIELPPAAPLDHGASSYTPPQSHHKEHSYQGPIRSGRRTKQEISDALEYAQFAVAALKTEEVNLAIDRLEMALKAIR